IATDDLNGETVLCVTLKQPRRWPAYVATHDEMRSCGTDAGWRGVRRPRGTRAAFVSGKTGGIERFRFTQGVFDANATLDQQSNSPGGRSPRRRDTCRLRAVGSDAEPGAGGLRVRRPSRP